MTKLRNKWLSNPDDFWNYDLAPGFLQSADAIAHHLFGDQASGKDIAVVDNLTSAIAIVTDSVIANIREPNGVVLISSMTYNAVRLAVEHGCTVANGRTEGLNLAVVSVDIPFPICLKDAEDAATASDIIVSAYRTVLERLKSEGKKVVFAFLDHITSVPAVLMPVRELIALCREYAVAEILVDGAHAPGQLDLTESGVLTCVRKTDDALQEPQECQEYQDQSQERLADYYVGNLHKWCFAAPTCALLWVSPRAPSRRQLHHPVVSHRYGEVAAPAAPSGSMVAAAVTIAAGGEIEGEIHQHRIADIPIFSECAMLGTRDYSAMLAVPASFRFVESLGGFAAIRTRNGALCAAAVNLLSTAWGTEAVVQHPSLQTCSMAMVGCPAVFGSSWEDSERLRLGLRDEHSIIIQKLFPVPGDRLYLRLSVAVYNTLEELQALSDAVLKLMVVE